MSPFIRVASLGAAWMLFPLFSKNNSIFGFFTASSETDVLITPVPPINRTFILITPLLCLYIYYSKILILSIRLLGFDTIGNISPKIAEKIAGHICEMPFREVANAVSGLTNQTIRHQGV